MSKVQMLRASVNQRLTAAAEEIFGLFERTMAEYEEELCRSKEENERQRKLLDAVFKPEVRLHRADVQQLVSKEEVPPEQQEGSPSLDQDQDPEPPHIKEEQEELWTSQEGEQLQGLEEADITKFPFSPVPVKSEEDDEEKPQSSQLHQSHTEQMETGADGGDCGGPEPARNPDPDRHSEPDPDDQTSDSSEPATEDSDDDWQETRELESPLNSQKKQVQIRCDKGGKSLSCSECGKRFSQKGYLTMHMVVHTGEKPYSCSVCDQRFTWPTQVKTHKCAGRWSSQLHQNHTEQMETGAAGEDCGGPEPARNPDPDRHSELSGSDKAAEPETEDRDGRVPVSGTTHVTDEKLFNCSECGKRFANKTNLKIHMTIHTGENSFSCLVCGLKFAQGGSLRQHMSVHSGKHRFCCSVCDKGFTLIKQLKKHICLGPRSSQLHQNQTEQMETGAAGEDCGGPEPARNPEPERFIRRRRRRRGLETDDQISDSSETEDSDDWTETREAPSHLKKKKKIKIPASEIRCIKRMNSFSCSECGKRFVRKRNLKRHSRIHTREKPFSCSTTETTRRCFQASASAPQSSVSYRRPAAVGE